MTRMAELQGPRALVCKREVNSDAGGATIFMVCLADGFLIDCGSSGYAQRRASDLAAIINADQPERFNYGKS